MPTSAPRKSSIGNARRGAQKAHIPFRGDNQEVGKKTGIAVQHIERKSDGFEPFEQLMSQADKRTPPRVNGRRKKPVLSSPTEEEDDENGEIDMDMDESNPNSPMEFFTNPRLAPIPASGSRVASSSRRTHPSSDIDFDKVPSPRPRPRFSVVNASAGPSHLSQSTTAGDHGNDDDGGMDDDFGGYEPQENESSPQNPQTSFTMMDREEDDQNDEDENLEDTPVKNPKQAKGKARATPQEQEQHEQEEDEDQQEQEQDMEEDIAQGMADLDNERHSDEDNEPTPKKVRTQSEKPKRTRGKPKKQELSPPPDMDGVRRGKRHRYKPLEWWRLEKVVYGKRDTGEMFVPHIKEIVRIPQELPIPLGKGKRKRSTTAGPRSKSKTVEEEVVIINPEEGWDDKTAQQGVVLDYETKAEVLRRIAFTAKMVEPKAAAHNDWFFQKVFGDGDFIAAGQLIIPPKGRKPSKGTKDNTYVFYVIEGAVNLKVHDTSLIMATGGMFMVPRGNTYFIENIADRDAKLFFTQARKIIVGEDEQNLSTSQRRASEPRRSSGQPQSSARSSSAGPAPGGSLQVNGRAMIPQKRATSTRI